MPYNISDPRRAIDDLVVRQADVFRKKMDIALLTRHRATGIDRQGRKVVGEGPRGSFEISYDALLIATGATPVSPEQPGFDLPGVLTLKRLEDGRRIKSWLASRSVRAAVIVGMGYIGMEMAEALRALDIEVTMVKPRPGLLPWLAPDLAAAVQECLTHNAVAVRTQFQLEGINAQNDRLRVTAQGGETLAADLVLVATGVRPNSDLAAKAGLVLGPSRSIAIDGRTRTSDPAIRAAGDCADAFHVVTGQRAWIPLALRANRAGWAAADDVCGKPVDLQGVVGSAVFKVFDLAVARTGLTAAEAADAGFEPAEVTIHTSSRAHGHPGASTIHVHLVGDKKSGRLLGAQMVGREGVAQRINAAAVALHARMTVEHFGQTDLAYAPPFGPTWDPLLVAANQLIKAL
ncbi:FAD-dependent oxidoreductase [Desulfatitalea alkaliphila]|nr:FAD-dependent oxidoreductase [Desulfatitalea alkaliphila]